MCVQVLDDWDFDHLISAHNGGCYGVGKETAQALLTESEPLLRQLSERNAKAAVGGLAGQVRKSSLQRSLLAHFWLILGSLLAQEHKPSEPMGWSETECECG